MKPQFNPIQLEEQIKRLPPQALLAEISKCKSLIATDKRNGDLHYTLGLMNMYASLHEAALDSFATAIKLSKNPEPSFAKITELLIVRMKDFSAAIPYYRKWLKIRENSAPLLTRLARCEMGAGKYEDALLSIKKAERLDRKDPVVYEVFSAIYAAMGNVEAAKSALERCAELNGNLEVSSRILNLPGYEPDLEKIEGFVEKSSGLSATRERLHLDTNIANAYEARGDYEKAFEFFARANEYGKDKLNKQNTLNAFKEVKEAFSAEYLSAKQDLGHETRQPVFVLGMPRSGSTLIESILAAHPEITGNGELHFMHDQLKRMGIYNGVASLAPGGQPSLKAILSSAPPNAYKQLAEGYIESSGFQKRLDTYQIDKLPHNFMAVGLIHMVFPNAKIIHSRRHPVDTILSCYKSSFSDFHAYATDIEFLGEYFNHYWALMKHWREVLPDRMLEVSYEDTVSNTELVARSMIDHIGVEWDDACLDHRSSKKTVRTASKWQVRQPIYTSSVQKWKNYEKQLQPAIDIMADAIAEYEAELDALQA